MFKWAFFSGVLLLSKLSLNQFYYPVWQSNLCCISFVSDYLEYFAPDFSLYPDIAARIENQNTKQVRLLIQHFLPFSFQSLSAAALGLRSKRRFYFFTVRARRTRPFSRGARVLQTSPFTQKKASKQPAEAIGRPLPPNEIGEWGIIFWWNRAVDTATFLTSVKG